MEHKGKKKERGKQARDKRAGTIENGAKERARERSGNQIIFGRNRGVSEHHHHPFADLSWFSWWFAEHKIQPGRRIPGISGETKG